MSTQPLSTQTLIRWSGMALIAAGLIYILVQPLHPPDTDPGAALDPRWALVHYAVAVHHLLVVLGLVGLYLTQAQAAGRLGLAAFTAALLANAFWVGGAIDEAILYPYLSAQQAAPVPPFAVFDPAGPLGAHLALVLAGLLVWDLGTILMGLAILRAGSLPRWAAIGLIAGNVALNAGAIVPGIFLVKIIGGELMGAAYAWLGYALWTQRGEAQLQARPAM